MGRIAEKNKEGWAIYSDEEIDQDENGNYIIRTRMTPFLETQEALAHYCVENGVSTFANMTASYEEWLVMIKEGDSYSCMLTPDWKMISGVAALSLKR